jgi:hypothetical protein
VRPNDRKEEIQDRRFPAAVPQPQGLIGGASVGALEAEQQIVHPGLRVAKGDKAKLQELGH